MVTPIPSKPDPATILKFIKLPVAGDLDGQLQNVLQQLQKAGIPAQFDARYNSNFRFSNFGRVIYIPWNEREYDLVLVTTVPWSETSEANVQEDFLAMAAQARKTGSTIRFRIASACPEPASIDYLFSPYGRSHFELRARMELGIRDSLQPVPHTQALVLAQRGLSLISEIFSRRLNVQNPSDITALDNLVLDELRRGTPRSSPLKDTSFLPVATMLLFGCVFGEMIAQSGRVTAKWTNNPKAPFTLGMAVSGSAISTLVVNPIGRVIKEFEKGDSESMTAFAQSLLGPLKARG